MTATLPAMFAKSSLAWPALFTLIGNQDIRHKIFGYGEYLREKNRKKLVRIKNFKINSENWTIKTSKI